MSHLVGSSAGLIFDRRSAGLDAVDVKSPPRRGSFGSIERYVEVRAPAEGRFEPGEITIEFSPENLGWVDPETLRVFHIDAEARTWELVADSGFLRPGAVRARVERPGIYGVVGLPGHPAVREAMHRACALPRGVLVERPAAGLLPICGRILCGPTVGRWSGGSEFPLEPPGGFGGNICDFCTGLRPPANGLPECQLLEPPERKPEEPEDPDKAATAYSLTALAWIGLLVPYGQHLVMPTSIEIFDLDPLRSTGSFGIKPGWCMSLAVSSAADRFYVTDVSVPEVSVYDNAGTQLGSVALSLISGGWWLDCVLSPDDATLYVATSYGIVVIDTATLSISAIVPSSGWLHGIAVSPDGATVAAPVAGGELLVLDAATLASTTITLGAGTANVVFADPKRVLTWNPTAGALVEVDLATGTLASVPTTPAGLITVNNSLVYDAATDTAYAIADHYSPYGGVPWTTEIVAVDLAAHTWSSKQFQRLLTIPGVTPAGRLLIAETVVSYVAGSEYLSIYEPASQTLTPQACPAIEHVRDLKVVR
jgi:hypothetical protein